MKVSDELLWWDKPENQEDFNLSISVIESDGIWVVSTNDKTKDYLGNKLSACASGKTKEQAISRLFLIIRHTHEFTEECRLNYQRFVPFRKGDWKKSGGTWFVVFGFHVYFRYGRPMLHGFYIPFTKLNISFSSDWKTYRKYKQKKSK